MLNTTSPHETTYQYSPGLQWLCVCVCVCANRDECMESQQLSREALRGALYCAVVTAHDSAVPAGANLGCLIVMTIDEATTHHFIHNDWTNHTTPPSEEPHAHGVKRSQYSVSLTPPTCTPPGTSTTHLPLCSRRRMLCRVIGRMPHHQYSCRTSGTRKHCSTATNKTQCTHSALRTGIRVAGVSTDDTHVV